MVADSKGLGRSARLAALSLALPMLIGISQLRFGSHSAWPGTWLGHRPVRAWVGPRTLSRTRDSALHLGFLTHGTPAT